MNPEENEYLAYAERVLARTTATAGARLVPITRGGSDRRFYRVLLPAGRTFLFMAYGRSQEENACWAGIAAFLAELDVPVPAVYGHDPERGLVVMEDLGDRDLWSFRHESWGVRGGLYRRVLARIAPLYTLPLPTLPPGRPGPAGGVRDGRDLREGAMAAANQEGTAGVPIFPRTMPDYDRGLYRWEHDYFFREFVRGACGIVLTAAEERPVREELDALSGRLLAAPPVLVHRDLQSQNIMIRAGEPVFIDFQGLRRGSLFYDLGSLLYDSYVPFRDDEREELLRYAYELLGDRGGTPVGDGADAPPGTTWPAFRAAFLDGSAQRLMQALGAFGFLGLKKGKVDFLGHIPRGVANLVAAASAGRLPRLAELAFRCREALGEGKRC
ncbi:MAG TPA: phosphotransferase [Syntrophales bacterium]|jgi:hypothetical protein|nr:phosphotransferase [Syntrophales bacterium]HOU76808.1 phosphotransferase [Syntrophales bacterium]HPC32356.1 phosphotransferase [Syntrophales bacterium]HQG33593.1 phosphotransferase [Syntrophales bacterium]HQI34766.1 phosphotransferase [Syntrophales bacterium]